jgi:hypothetical protein
MVGTNDQAIVNTIIVMGQTMAEANAAFKGQLNQQRGAYEFRQDRFMRNNSRTFKGR